MAIDYWFDPSALLAEPTGPLRPELDGLRSRLRSDSSIRGRLAALRAADSKALLKDVLIPDRLEPIEEFARANGLQYRGWQKKSGHEASYTRPGEYRPGLLVAGCDAQDLVWWEDDGLLVEFANLRPSGGIGWGCVTIRHGLPLPHVILDGRGNDPVTPQGGKRVTNLSRRQRSEAGDRYTHLDSLKKKIAPLDLGADAARDLTVWCERGREADARSLLAGPPLRLACETGEAFDVEVKDGWVFLYGYKFDLCTTEVDRWAWLFSLTSRWLDVLHGWGAADPSRLPFHTAAVVGRPESLREVPRAHVDTGAGLLEVLGDW